MGILKKYKKEKKYLLRNLTTKSIEGYFRKERKSKLHSLEKFEKGDLSVDIEVSSLFTEDIRVVVIDNLRVKKLSISGKAQPGCKIIFNQLEVSDHFYLKNLSLDLIEVNSGEGFSSGNSLGDGIYNSTPKIDGVVSIEDCNINNVEFNNINLNLKKFSILKTKINKFDLNYDQLNIQSDINNYINYYSENGVQKADLIVSGSKFSEFRIYNSSSNNDSPKSNCRNIVFFDSIIEGNLKLDLTNIDNLFFSDFNVEEELLKIFNSDDLISEYDYCRWIEYQTNNNQLKIDIKIEKAISIIVNSSFKEFYLDGKSVEEVEIITQSNSIITIEPQRRNLIPRQKNIVNNIQIYYSLEARIDFSNLDIDRLKVAGKKSYQNMQHDIKRQEELSHSLYDNSILIANIGGSSIKVVNVLGGYLKQFEILNSDVDGTIDIINSTITKFLFLDSKLEGNLNILDFETNHDEVLLDFSRSQIKGIVNLEQRDEGKYEKVYIGLLDTEIAPENFKSADPGFYKISPNAATFFKSKSTKDRSVQDIKLSLKEIRLLSSIFASNYLKTGEDRMYELYREELLNADLISKKKGIVNFPERILNRIIYGSYKFIRWGHSPIRILIASFLTSCLFSFLYGFLDFLNITNIQENMTNMVYSDMFPEFVNSVYFYLVFSISSFFSIVLPDSTYTPLGSWEYLLSAMQSILGVVFITVFVASVTRKFLKE